MSHSIGSEIGGLSRRGQDRNSKMISLCKWKRRGRNWIREGTRGSKGIRNLSTIKMRIGHNIAWRYMPITDRIIEKPVEEEQIEN